MVAKLSMKKIKTKIRKGININFNENIRNVINKVLILFLFTLIFRFLSSIPVPGVPLNSLKEILSNYSFGEILNMTSSGALANTTLIAIGLSPYINASVIIQLLESVIPKLKELREQGLRGRMVLSMYTRLLTLPLALLQGMGIYIFLKQSGLPIGDPDIPGLMTPIQIATLITSFTGGALLLTWISELISEYKFVNGSSYLIAAGILSDIPGKFTGDTMNGNVYVMIGVIVFIILWVGFVVYVTEAEKRLTIKYAKIMTFGSKPVSDNHMPLKLNQSGVMPVIFALSFLSTPSFILSIISNTKLPERFTWITKINEIVNKATDSNGIYYNIILTVLIILFSLFYTFVVFNPEETAKNLQKQGAYLPGVRPGKETQSYLTKIMLRLGVVGSLFLAFITLIPFLVPSLLLKYGDISVPMIFSGTGILIVIGVSTDVLQKVRSLKSEEYRFKGIL